MKYTVTVYHDKVPTNAGWRWTIRARNGRIVGASSEAYRNRSASFRNLNTVTGLSFYMPHGVSGDFVSSFTR
jgi:uncharacterized protein YegP (UPF0339 family)